MNNQNNSGVLIGVPVGVTYSTKQNNINTFNGNEVVDITYSTKPIKNNDFNINNAVDVTYCTKPNNINNFWRE